MYVFDIIFRVIWSISKSLVEVAVNMRTYLYGNMHNGDMCFAVKRTEHKAYFVTMYMQLGWAGLQWQIML